MYDSLLEWDPKLNIRPALAESYKVVNSKRIVWNLRKGVKFHNGQELDADDVVYSFQQMLNPPLPGSTATLGQVPAIARCHGSRKYQVQMDLKAPDARVYGYLAWRRYSTIVPNNMYQTLNPATQGIGTGPFMLERLVRPERPRQLRQEPELLEAGPAVPGRGQLQDHHRRAVAHRGAARRHDRRSDWSRPKAPTLNGTPTSRCSTTSPRPSASSSSRSSRARTSPGRTSASARRSTSRSTGRTSSTRSMPASASTRPGRGRLRPVADPEDQLQSKYEKYDLPTAKELMSGGGSKGFDVTMTTFSTPTDFAAIAALIKNDLSQIGINVNIVPQDPVTFGANNSAGTFDWDLTARGMRGDVDGYVAEYNPCATRLLGVVQGLRRSGNAKRSGASSATAGSRSTRRSGCRCTSSSTSCSWTRCSRSALVSVSKFQVVNKRLKNMYVAFTDFNPASERLHRKLERLIPAVGPARCRARRWLFRSACSASSSSESLALFATLVGGVGRRSSCWSGCCPATSSTSSSPGTRGDARAEAAGERAARPERLVLRPVQPLDRPESCTATSATRY